MDNQLRIVGPYSALSGYSKMTRAVLRTAILAGFEVEAVESDMWEEWTQYTAAMGGHRICRKVPPKQNLPIPEEQERDVAECQSRTVAPDAPTLLIQVPAQLAAWQEYRSGPRIGWTMTESDDLCPNWRHGCRNVDLLLAPSRYVRHTFSSVLPDVPNRLLPLPVDERLWTPDEYVADVPGRPPFLFLSVFSTTERKQWRQVMQAFAEEFAGEGREVGLLVKPTRTAEVEEMANWCRAVPGGAWVYVDTEPRTDWTMAALYRACDVYVGCASEGFGLPFVEAAMCGKPSVALDRGGAADVVTAATGYPVRSEMVPLVGHMPHVYPRTHRFATAGVDDIRAALRKAYSDETSGRSRAKAAQEAGRAYTCHALADSLPEVVKAAVRYRRYQADVTAPRTNKPVRWATCAGAWGDTFATCGRIQRYLARMGEERIGVLHFGIDPAIREWLEAQPWVRECRQVLAPSKQAFTTSFAALAQVRMAYSLTPMRRIAEQAGIDPDTLAFTHLNLSEPQEPIYWQGARLPRGAREWAEEQARDIGAYLLLNPVSIASNQHSDHWPFWSEAIEWLLAETPHTYVLTDQHRAGTPPHERLVNLTGEAPTMSHVLALAELSAGMVTTSNNLGIYAPIADIPTVAVCARTCGRESFYHRWMETEPVGIVEYDEPLAAFTEAFRACPFKAETLAEAVA